MIGLLQRVTQAQVDVAGQCIGRIGRGLLILVGVQAPASFPLNGGNACSSDCWATACSRTIRDG